MKQVQSLLFAAALALSGPALAQEHPGHDMAMPDTTMPLEPLPRELPAWISNSQADHIFYKAAHYNFNVYRIPKLARDLNAVAVGHAMAYEDLVTGKARDLDSKTFERINWVLNHPPKLMPDEGAISPTFQRMYGYLEKAFDWAHILHAQTIDVLADEHLSDSAKDAEIQLLWEYYRESAPFTMTGLPMNMEYLDSHPYSGAFRRTYPKVNGLFWGYHWLQTTMYDMLWHTPPGTHIDQYDVVGQQYHETELYRTDRDFMPMMGESSPRFSRQFPEMANAFDNLHMLHDMVNDILASDWIALDQKQEQIKRALWMVLGSTHENEDAGEGEPGTLHDHRFPMGMPGMGMMKGSDDQIMYMSGMGWMNMSECGHCTVPLRHDDLWGASVSANGWTMLVRCPLCARDMASETPGRAIIRAATEDPSEMLVLISDDQGYWHSNIDSVLFLEVMEEHPECAFWSRAFTTRAAFERFVTEEEPDYKDAKPMTLEEWSTLNGGRPETYRKIRKPNPYHPSEDQLDDADTTGSGI